MLLLRSSFRATISGTLLNYLTFTKHGKMIKAKLCKQRPVAAERYFEECSHDL